MPLFTPGNRKQSTFYPVKPHSFGLRVLEQIERWVKGPLFGCRMCGNCLLQETALICPMSCPKGLRNGPCGGSTPEMCYVDERSPCTWYAIYDRAFRMGREDKLLEVLPPMDWDKTGGETWADVIQSVRRVGTGTFVRGMLAPEPAQRAQMWDSVFRPIRQPDWWEGDDQYHPPAYSEPASELERRLKNGEFVVAAEISPPISTATGKLIERINLLRPYVAAINFTDNPSATPRMSSLACSQIALQYGAEPVFQMTARDRTRTGLQSEVIGASALGVRNMLCIAGDHSRLGPHPMSRADIVDVDAVQMLWILRRMRDEGKYVDGRPLKSPPHFFLGAAASPFASRPEFQALREEKKVNAGAQFFQTNLVFDADGLDIWLNELAKRNVMDKVYILIGITPLKSLRMALHMHENVPGVRLPERVLKRLEDAGDGAQQEGYAIALETIEAVRHKQGVNGIHIMAVGWEEVVPDLVRDAGLLPAGFIAPA
ncbi:MAG: methylenetetrahydrofolate reductase C-terminal domain-containing protein [Anaerolineae bacterium]|nr:methylenetetrahydrofolate reductase C-terminal domain-containing protein [Anaerolineae bacterium]